MSDMRGDAVGDPGDPRRFPTTHWSLVDRAGRGEGEAKRAALADLLRAYAPAMRSYLVNRRRVPQDRADDLVQSFVADKVLGGDFVGRAERERGRFRSFLVAALERHAINAARHAAALRRAPAGGAVALDERAMGAAAPPAAEPFEVAWARQVLGQAIDRMRAECEANGRADVWGVFEGRVLGPTLGQSDPVPYAELVARHGLASPTQASNVLVTGTRMFARSLRAVVARYEPDDARVDEEIADLRQILSGAGAG